jgi:NADP-dependent aldehyde dehydrogenase
MTLQPVLINGQWRQADAPAASFQAVNPTLKTKLPEEYPVSSAADVEAALQAAHEAIVELRSLTPDHIADFLERYASNVEACADALVEMAYAETALPREPRLRTTELPRTVNQLRQAAAAARSRSWCHATIDTKLNIRSMYGPLNGAVIVMGPNNFPFAFNSAAGGDFAAAIAAGNPVIAKANTGHPGTTRLFTEAAFAAVQASGLPKAMVQLMYRTPPDVGFRLVSHPLTGATGFTGSRSAGMKLKAAADNAGKPIYLEMSSINPVYVLPGGIAERGDAIAVEFTNSCTLGAGQFCTNPGFVVVIQNEASEVFLKRVAAEFEARTPGILLGQRSPGDLADAIAVMTAHGAQVVTGGHEVQDTGYSFENTVLRVSGADFLKHPEPLQTEAFGAVSLYVFAEDADQLLDITHHLEGNLTGSIYSDSKGSDDALYARLEPILRAKVGRLLNDKMPTGVAVTPAMNHGGPYPATGHPGFTAVGVPASMLRFGALHCYDNVRPDRLPPELRDTNPTGAMWRLIDGEWSQQDVSG